MPTGTIYDTTKHEFAELPNASTTCRYCKQGFTDAIHFQPASDSGEQWLAGANYDDNPTLSYVDENGVSVQLTLSNEQVQMVVDDMNLNRITDSGIGEVVEMLKGPLLR